MSEEYFYLNETQPRSVLDNWQYIHLNLLQVIDNFVPTKLSGTRSHLPWLTVSLKRLIRKKQRVYNKAKLYQCPTAWKQFKDLQHQIRSLLRKQHWQYLSDIFNNCDENTNKSLWRYIESRRHDKVGIGTLHTPNGTPVIHPGKKAQLLNNQFKSVFTLEDLQHIPSKGPSPYSSIPDITITTPGVEKLLSEINPYKAHGPDDIPGRVVRETASVLAPMLAHLFQQSLHSGNIPPEWKLAYVTPIYKKGNKEDPKNYRPVSLTSIISKTMEHILSSQILNHLENHGILTSTQFGFRQQHSCESQLLLTTDDFARYLDNNIQVDVGILDFSKAFDKVPHKRLAAKLNYYGIRGNLLTWIEAFLQNRSQSVVVDGHYSSPISVSSGVPQGTVLGPTLFLLYINDIDVNIQSQIRLFADDCLIYRPIHSNDDHDKLQQDLNSLTRWATTWQMEFNVTKCNIIQLSKGHKKSHFTYTMGGVPLTVVEEHQYLGILLNDKLSWRSHIDHTCNKANRLLGFLQRNLPSDNSCQFIRALSYKQLILPILSYCASIWDPCQQYLINKIEIIQHRAARFVLNHPWRKLQRDSITLMLSELQWPPLQTLRRNARLTLLYKIIHHHQIIPHQYHPTPAFPHTRSNHCFKFQHYQSKTDVYRNSFFPKTVPEWNNLPSMIAETDNLNSFKNKLHDY